MSARTRPPDESGVSLTRTAGPAAAAAPAADPDADPSRGVAVRRTLTGLLCPAVVIVIVVLATRCAMVNCASPVPGGMSELQCVGLGLALAAAMSAAALARAPERTPQWQVAAGAVTGAASLACYRLAAHHGGSARQVEMTCFTVGALLVMATSAHLALGLPDGRLTRAGRSGTGAARRPQVEQPSRARRAGVGLA